MISFDDFEKLLDEWGKWSRGGYPRYRSPLAQRCGFHPEINDDLALRIDRLLCKVRKHTGEDRTKSFELFYVSGWAVTEIADKFRKDYRIVKGEILGVEMAIFCLYREGVML